MPFSLRIVIGLLAMATALALLNVFVLNRAVRAFGLSARQRRIAIGALAVPFVFTILFRATGRLLPIGFGQSLAVGISAAEMGVVIAAVLLGVAALVERVGRWITRLRGGVVASDPAAASLDPRGDLAPKIAEGAIGNVQRSAATTDGGAAVAEVVVADIAATDIAATEIAVVDVARARVAPTHHVTRRAFVEQAVAGSALLVGGASAGYGAIFGRHDYELATVPVRIPGLSRAADGFTIVQLSDIHLGLMVGETEERAAEELARKAKGDLIVLTGDLIDHDVRYTERLGRLVRRLSAIAPVAAIPGNHDYYTGIDEVLATLRSAGATTLVNQATTLLGDRGGIVLVGLDDPSGAPNGGGPDLARALAGVRSDAPRIVLCHNPRTFVDIAGQIALQISGHTHGGQVNMGFRPADVVLRHGYIAGLYETSGSHIYVNRGFGTAGPAARVGAPPEVSRIVLVAA